MIGMPRQLQHLVSRLLPLCWLALTAAPAAIADAAGELQQRLEPIQAWQAHFEQRVFDERGELQQASSGQIEVLRPNRLRWESEEPFRYLVVTDGEVLWRYDPDLEQANREAFRGELADTPGLILSGEPSAIAARYRVEHRAGEGRNGKADKGEGEDHFVLYPLSDTAPFRRLELHWRGETLLRLRMLDALDQQTEVRFTDSRSDVAPDAQRFRFSPPPGTDVIDHGP